MLVRDVPGSVYRDAMGCYPLFACTNWSELKTDLDALSGELISVAFVTDPFGAFDPNKMRGNLDICVDFKEHYVVHLGEPIEKIVSRHHRQYARKSLRDVQVEISPNPQIHLDEWVELYGHLVQRHGITGIRAFSRKAFAAQLSIPGVVMLRALHQGECLGIHLWYLQGDVAYSHLEALSPKGYQLCASYALYWYALACFMEHPAKIIWMDLGAGAGISGEGADGLTFFKRGWANDVKKVWFCGRILDRDKYLALVKLHNAQGTSYFPAYRSGEFGGGREQLSNDDQGVTNR